jgi:hypothetical protein
LTRSSRTSLGAALLIACVVRPGTAQPRAEADQVMAAFVSRFPQFVEWPASALEGRISLDVCVVEPDPFGDTLEALLADEALNGRRLTVRRINRPSLAGECHVLYVPRTARSTSAFLAATEGQPVLTIGESSDFLDDGGILSLVIVERRVRFGINTAAATRAGLRLSSQLLGLAVEVRSGSP